MQVRPLLTKYCVQCHGGAKPKADLALDIYRDAASVAKAREIWESVLENVRTHAMPPEKSPAPTQAERDQACRWIEAELERLGAQQRDPGRVTLRRLNRAEYNNTVRDLMGVTFKPADDFPADDVGYGFDNIGDVLSLSPVLLEKYLAAAETIVNAAIVTEETKPSTTERILADKLESSLEKGRKDYGTLGTNGELRLKHKFPKDGEYLVRVSAAASQAGDELAEMVVRIDKKDLKSFDVSTERESPLVYEFRTPVKAGQRTVAVAFTNDFYDPEAKDRSKRDRNLYVDYVEVHGPVNLDPKDLPDTHKRIIPRQPEPDSEEEFAFEILRTFASKAFRRPATQAEVDRLVSLVKLVQDEGGSFERGIQLAVQAVLVSPHFLFKVELDAEPNNPAAVHAINDYELATRLSYFLWSSLPDHELFTAAYEGRLRQPGVLEAQVRRMLKDAKSEALVQNFAGQWLQTRALHGAAPDAKLFQTFNDALRQDFEDETNQFFAHIMREDRSILEFINADYTFVNERLAKHYGIKDIKGREFRKVTLKDPARGGVITQASVLTVTSNPIRTSPVKRGKWILENILGTPPPPPPPMVPELAEEEQVVLSGTLRQRMEQHRKDPNCASCHQRMDPLGFGLENFNAIGAFRTQDGKFPLDTSGTLPDGSSFNGPKELKAMLATRKDDFARCLAEKLLTYALGRGLEYYDKQAVDRIVRETAADGYKFSRLVLAIVGSEPFQKRRGNGVEP